MAKVFNTTAVCIPEEHYMVNIDKRLKDIKKLVDERKYFTMNRARQYEKTTTLLALEQYLKNDYYVVLMDFQTFDAALFENGNVFSLAFADSFIKLFRRNKPLMSDNLRVVIEDINKKVDDYSQHFTMKKLFENLSDICLESDKPIVLMIDEVDSATNNQVFLDFLAQLRAYYIKRATQPTFWSVILASVYDVKNLRIKIRPEEEHRINSPWNTRESNEENESLLSFDDCSWNHKELIPYDIATDFEIDMSFSKNEIAKMLCEYESDYHTGMNIDEMARLIYNHTSGYPFLVSRLCKLIDEKVSLTMGNRANAWTLDGFMEADRILTSEKNTLFESMIGKIINYPKLNSILQNKIFKGETVSYNASTQEIDLATMFGIIKNANGVVVPANKIFAKVLADYYLSQDEIKSIDIYKVSLRDKNQFVENGKLNMKRILERFIESFTDLYAHKGQKFIEDEGKKYFLLYLRPIINGVGHYSLEAVTSNNTRTDVIVYYNRDLFIIETKIWHGAKANKEAEEQLLGYMESYHQDTGYLLTFNFNKTKKQELREVKIEGKTLIEAIV